MYVYNFYRNGFKEYIFFPTTPIKNLKKNEPKIKVNKRHVKIWGWGYTVPLL